MSKRNLFCCLSVLFVLVYIGTAFAFDGGLSLERDEVMSTIKIDRWPAVVHEGNVPDEIHSTILKLTETAEDDEKGLKPLKKELSELLLKYGSSDSEFFVACKPGHVNRYYVVCNKATYLDVCVADCCMSGDHWEVKVKVWDRNPNTAVATAPGPAGKYGIRARVYDYGTNPLIAMVECRYLHGINVFPAGGHLNFKTNGNNIKVINLGRIHEIPRTP